MNNRQMLFIVAMVLAAFCVGFYLGAQWERSDWIMELKGNTIQQATVYPEGVTLKTEKVFKNRYFLLAFAGNGGATGNIGYITYHGDYPNRKEVYQYLRDSSTVKVGNPIITFITELNQQEYNQFFKK